MAWSNFLPRAGRGAAVDRAVRARLAKSLEQVYERAGPFISYDKEALCRLLGAIEHESVRPAVFGIYTDLVERIIADDSKSAQRLSNELLGFEVACRDTRIVTLIDADLGDGQAARYQRLVDDDPETVIQLAPIADKSTAAGRVGEALTLLDNGAPGLAEEVRALAREVVMVEPGVSDTNEPEPFDGASTLYLWGAVFANCADKSPLDLLETLTHETSHLLLFGLTMGYPLVANTGAERYWSPLRGQERPMEGLVHAAFVLARMHYAISAVATAGVLSREQAEQARVRLADYSSSFFGTLEIIDRHARLVPEGAEMLRGAADYMSAARKAA